jgi:hypothetical protein
LSSHFIYLNSLDHVQMSVQDIQLASEKLLDTLSRVEKQTDSFLQQHGRPSFLTRVWLGTAISTGIGLKLLYSAWSRRFDIWDGWKTAYDTVWGFLVNWVLEPAQRIWKTVRHEETLQLTAGALSLSSDLDVCIALNFYAIT